MDRTTKTLLSEAGHTFAEDAGIVLKDQPAALFKLLVLANLLSTRISSDIAVAAARELFEAGGGTARGMARLSWQERVDALGRAHYVRYDESSADRLIEMAQRVSDEYFGDLREIAERSHHDVAAVRRMLKQFKGIGDTGADIYLREVQDSWTWVRPYFDDRATATAKKLGLPTDPVALGELSPRNNARLAAALVRISLDDDMRQQVAG
jgi:endonuclease III